MDSENLQRTERRQQLCRQKDVHAVKEVISKVKSQGLFDQFRKECLADVDTKPAYHNLVHRVEKFVESFLDGKKWSADLNKNQLRETLRRHLNNSGVMNMGVDRIIEQVVNPKILLGIKPKIDDAVCDHLGIDLKVRQQEQQKKKKEQKQKILQQQQQFQQQHLHNFISHNVKADNGIGTPPGILPTPSAFPWPRAPIDDNFRSTSNSGMTDLAASGINFNPNTLGFGGMVQHNFMGCWGPGLSGMEGFNQTMRPVVPDQSVMLDFGGGYSPTVTGNTTFFPTTSPPLETVNTSFNISSMQTQPVAFKGVHDFSSSPLGPPAKHLLNSASNIGSSPAVPGFSQQPGFAGLPGILPNTAGTTIKPPPPGSIPPPPGTVPVVPPTPFTPCQSLLQPVPSTQIIPSLFSHTVSKVLKEESSSEEVTLLTKPEKYLTEQQIESDEQIEQITEFEWVKEDGKSEEETTRKVPKIKLDDRIDSFPLKYNLIDVFQDTEYLSEDENTLYLSANAEEADDRQKNPSMRFDDFGKQHLPTGKSGKGLAVVQSVTPIVIFCTYLLGVSVSGMEYASSRTE